MKVRVRFVARKLYWLVLLTICLAWPTVAFAQPEGKADELLPGFVKEVVVKGLDGPTAFAVAPDGRIYFTQKSGAVKVFQNGKLLRKNFLDLSAEVNQAYNRGLVGIALHPDFPKTPFVYLAYVYQPEEAKGHKDVGALAFRGVIRVTADPADLNKALPDSTLVILGANGTFDEIGNPDKSDSPPYTCQDEDGAPVTDCIPVEGTADQANVMHFSDDGALYVAVGDGGEYASAGLRAQDTGSLSGKILRINPLTGAGYRDNPFYDRNPNSNRSKVYMMGLRNPFRFAVHPSTGDLIIGDVGASTWEEINLGRKGANFGWPCFEGDDAAMDTGPCAKVQAAPRQATFPILRIPTHGGAGCDRWRRLLYRGHVP